MKFKTINIFFERKPSHLFNEDKLSVSMIREIYANLTDHLQYDKV